MPLLLKYLKYLFYTIVIFLVFLVSLLLVIPYVYDMEDFTQYIVEELEKQIELKILYNKGTLKLFPVVGIEFSYLQIYDDDKLFLDANHFDISLSSISLMKGEIIVKSCTLSDGKVFLERSPSGRFEIFDPMFSPKSRENPNPTILPSTVLAKLPNSILVENLHLYFTDLLYKNSYYLYLWRSKLYAKTPSNSIHLDLYGKLNNRKIEIYKDISFVEDSFSYESLRFKGVVILDNFSLSLFDDALIIFPYSDFKHAIVSGSFFLEKENDDLSIIRVNSINIKNVSYKNSIPFGDCNISVIIKYSWKNHLLSFTDIKGEWKDYIKTTGNGYLTFTSKPIIYFEANAEYVDIEALRKIIGLWLDADLEKSIFFKGLPNTGYAKKYVLTLDLHMKNVSKKGIFIPEVNTKVSYKFPVVSIEKFIATIYDGRLFLEGSIDISQDLSTIKLKGEVERFSTSKLLEKITTEKYLNGNLFALFSLYSQGNDEDEFISNLKSEGTFVLRDGELIGYLNVLRPLASLGKIINLTGPTGDSLSYESIKGNFSYKNRIFKISGLSMKGVGLDASGKGEIGMNAQVDFQLTLSLSGIAGKAIKLPIIYKGVFGKNLPYVDPIWVGTVYAGSIFLAGPAGATVGGIAGSAASDYVNKLLRTLRSFFVKEKEEY